MIVALSGIGLRLSEGLIPLSASLAVAVALFVGLTVLFHFGAVGGGDVKLLTAASLLFPASAVPAVLALISWAGGVLAVGWIVGVRLFAGKAAKAGEHARGKAMPVGAHAADPPGGDAAMGYQGHGLPYGVAIFAGTVAGQLLLT